MNNLPRLSSVLMILQKIRLVPFMVISLFYLPVLAEEKSVVFLNSYHAGYQWSDQAFQAFKIQLNGKPVKIHHFYMNTKYIKNPQDINAIVNKALLFIEYHQPAVLVAADDNASKFIIEPHFKNSDIPVVFLGVNLDASVYGYPYTNSTGMVELEGLENLIDVIRQYTQYQKVGMIFTDTTTSLKKYRYYLDRISDFKGVVVKNMGEFKLAVRDLAHKDYLLAFDTITGLDGYDESQVQSFLANQVKRPIITVSNSSQDIAHFGYIKVPDEQGIWAAQATYKILTGTPVSEIPSTQNNKYQIFINEEFAKQCDVKIPQVFYKLPYIQLNE